MKKTKLFLIFFIFNFFYSEAQTNIIDLKTLEKITNMSSSEFEDWALSKGLTYEGLESKKYSSFDVLSYKNGSKYQMSILINKDGTARGFVQYATSNNSEYINLKKNCSKIGYKFKNSEYVEGDDGNALFHYYYLASRELSFYTSNKDKFYGFNIILKNKNNR